MLVEIAAAKPLVLYGTAFKKGQTDKFTAQALANGFFALDTANYPTSYNEPQVGDAIADALMSGVDRSSLFVQTKFTPAWAHRDKVPFNPDQSVEAQIRESVQQSLDHLKTDYVDSLLLHAPFEDDADTLAAWDVLETFVPHTIRTLGVSNFTLPQLRQVYEHAAHVKPAIIQNRFYRDTGYDIELRDFCKEHNITYQAFYMLRSHPEILESDVLRAAAVKLGVEKELAFYVLILSLGGTQVLNGTTKTERMLQDTKTIKFVFSEDGAGVLQDLQPDIAAFRELLVELAKPK